MHLLRSSILIRPPPKKRTTGGVYRPFFIDKGGNTRMKLSQMNSNQAADAIIRISEPAYAILGDEAMADTLKEFGDLYSENPAMVKLFGFMVAKMLPAVLKNHKNDLDAILAVLTEKTVDELQEENSLQYIRDVKACIDKDLIDFFRELTPQRGKSGKK